MKTHWILVAILAAGCSGSPTAPTPAPAVPPIATLPPAVVVPPAAPVPVPNPLLSDPRFSLAFYRMFALGALPDGSFGTLQRQAQAPRIYLRTVDDAGRAIDTYTLNETAAALINTAGSLTGVFGLAGMEQGTSTRQGQAGWITVRWSDQPNGRVCGTGQYGGELIVLYPKSPNCRCSGGPQVTLSAVRHELGHVLGFYHTDSRDDLMYPTVTACDKQPSEREVFHARVAYSQPIGSINPR